jgi:hypothetical protein
MELGVYMGSTIPGMCPESSNPVDDCMAVEVEPFNFMTMPEPSLEECDYGLVIYINIKSESAISYKYYI